jgi:hypothetical protein
VTQLNVTSCINFKERKMIVLVDTNKVPNPTSEFETIGEVSDGYHTFDELYNIRMLYNAAFFNELAKDSRYNVHKSKRHSDGEECFGGGWFIVKATLPAGQISNHYELKDWDLFHCEERECADTWDGHSPETAAKRLEAFVRDMQQIDEDRIAESLSLKINSHEYVDEASNINHNGHEYVDLCLPSGTLWAKCNVGATKETDYGGHYQWGGTDDFTDTEKNCAWETYSHGTNYDALTKYNLKSEFGTVDNKAELELSDDVAHQVMGGDWHMPSVLHINELLSNTTSEWTTVDGVKGRRFTSKFNGRSIFIPAAGWRDGRALNGVGNNCFLWSRSLSQTDPNCAYDLYFDSVYCSIDNDSRYFGMSVRGIIG